MAKNKTKVTINDIDVSEAFNQPTLAMTSAKLTEDKDLNSICHYGYVEVMSNGSRRTILVKCDDPVHEDLIRAFARFNAQLAIICEEVEPGEVSDIDNSEGSDKLAQFTVSEVVTMGTIESGTVVLKGSKMLSTLEQVILQSPKVKTTDDDYSFINELLGAVQNLQQEVTAYHYGKVQYDPQLKLEFEPENQNA
jgi:hypothetical protein